MSSRKLPGRSFSPSSMISGTRRTTWPIPCGRTIPYSASYVNDLLPHVLWMSLLIARLGKREGIRHSFDLAKLAHNLHVSDKHVNFAICGNYAKLTQAEATAFLEKLDAQGTLSLYREALSPLLHLHPNCPMRALDLPAKLDSRESLIERLRNAVDAILDRYGNPAAIMQANVLVIRASTGGLFFNKGIEIPDFDSLVHSPDSEAAQRAASFARSGAMQEFMPDETQEYMDWPKVFWNANYKLDRCTELEVTDD
jgi:hypothetical protein